MVDVYLTEISFHSKSHIYQVWVNGEPYSQFDWRDYPLTWSQQWDVASYYREGLND